MKEHEKPWNPLTIEQITQCFSNADFPWCIAGGYALELAIGKKIRDHADIDILVFHRDHGALREYLADWDCWVADPPGHLRCWSPGSVLLPHVHDVWCRIYESETWRFQVMIDQCSGNNWFSRRDKSISLPIDSIITMTRCGIPFLVPHVQLYYKAKNIRAKDQKDFDAVVRHPDFLDIEWLRWAIACSYGLQHIWLRNLSE